jgi:hypothetical protein
MAFKSYGGVVWNGEPTESYHSTTGQMAKLAVAVAAGGAGMYLATKPMADGQRPIDYVAARARLSGNLSPFQILNTFRVPEVLSPFTSMKYKVQGQASMEGVTYWGREYLSNAFQQSDSTYQWLKYTTGLSTEELGKRGITRRMSGAPSSLADAIVWEAADRGSSGSLYSVFGGKYNEGTGRWQGGVKKLLSHDISLQAMSHEVVNPFTQERGVNRIAAGMFAAGDMYSNTGFTESEVLLGRKWDNAAGAWVKKQASFMPVPAAIGDINNLSDLARRTTMVRGVAAFEMDRFNRLISGVADQFLGPKGGAAFKSILGVAPGVRPGPASAMMLRFGGRAALAGGAILAVGQTDWARRQFGMPGQVVASGLVSTGIGFAAGKLGLGPRAAFMASAASFFGQMVLPGFDQGVVQGLATGAVNLDIARANSLNPFNYLRRTLEGFAPGSTDWETGALLAIGGVAASSARIPRRGMSLAQSMLESMGPGRLGLDLADQSVGMVGLANTSVRDLYYQRVSSLGSGLPHSTFGQRRRLMQHLRNDVYKGNRLGMMQDLNSAFYQAEQDLDLYRKANPMNEALERRLRDISAQFGATPNWVGQLRKEAAGFGAQAYYSFFGADLSVDRAFARRIGDMGFKTAGRLGKWASVGLAIFGAHQLLGGGLLGSKETSQDLKDIYGGRKMVAVKSSRWWEAGGTPFEGGETEYYRPHQYHLMMNRVREKGIWGVTEDSISPIGKFFRKNFTYELEERNYWDRPYPISSAAFSDVPIIGGVLSSTIGQLIKPAKIMHAGEWIRPGEGGGLEYGSVFQGSRREPAMALGAHHGIPQNPFGLEAQSSFLSYQFRELEGMTGWAKNVAQQVITGEDQFGTDSPMLADAGMMTSSRVRFWEMQMGGGLFTNEFLRRVLPRYRSEIDRVNPIANNMPSWLPDKFKWGDPYRSIEWGEGRLPGAGYSALHPELRGVDPEAYPLLFRYAILSDVAPLSAEYNMTKKLVYQRRADGQYNQRQVRFMEQVDRQHAEAVSGFADDRMHERAIRLPGSSLTRAAWAGGQQLARGVAAPAEYLVPMGFRPMQKLMGDRAMIEQYEYERMYGTPMAFWDKPWRDWLRPSMYSAMNMMGWEGKPLWRQQADAAGQYFDQLEFLKWAKLREQAELAGDKQAAQQYRWAQANTRAGVNPQGSPMSIYWTLPESERKFFNAFAHASGKDRHRILEMVPADQAHLYKAIWSRMDSGDQSMWAGADNAISDAYMARQEAAVSASMSNQPMPGEDWVGWHEDVDMSDIAVRYVDRTGRELSDYGMWDKQLKKSMQQPMLAGSTDYLFQGLGGSNVGMTMNNQLRYMTGAAGARGHWQVSPWGGMMNSVQVDYNDNRSADITVAMERYLGGY